MGKDSKEDFLYFVHQLLKPDRIKLNSLKDLYEYTLPVLQKIFPSSSLKIELSDKINTALGNKKTINLHLQDKKTYHDGSYYIEVLEDTIQVLFYINKDYFLRINILLQKKTDLKDTIYLLEIFSGIVLSQVETSILKNINSSQKLKYQQLIENASDIFYTCNYKGEFTYANPVAVKFTGYSMEEILGKPFLEMIRQDYRPIAAQFYKEQFQKLTPNTYFEFPLITKSGEEKWVSQNVQSFSDNTIVSGFQAIVRDITQLKRIQHSLEKSEQIFRELSEHAPVGIFLTDPNGDCYFVNERWCQFAGLTPEQAKGQGWAKALYIDDRKAVFDEWYTSVKEDREFNLEYRFKSPKGKITWLRGNSVSVKNPQGEITGFIGTVTDITDIKHYQHELIDAKEAAESSIKARENFLSVVSHEIRTPMNAILGMTDLLLNENPKNDQLEYLNGIKYSADNLLIIINDILDFSKIESGKVEFENIPFSVRDVLYGIKQTLKFKAGEKNIDIIINIPDNLPQYISGDPTRLNQILMNLVGNAIKFTEQGFVEISIKLLQDRKGIVRLLFGVRDTGIGIPQDKLDHIFESFSQANSDTSRKYGGTGLGLTITKKIIDLLGGSIGVESALGIGSLFTFAISYEEVTNEEIRNNIEAELLFSHFNNLNLLLVEDNKMNQLVATRYLSKWGIQYEIANNGLEAILKLKSNDYDIILMDLQMPELDGYEATKRIRNELKLKLPIIALTASALLDVKTKVLNAGMTDYLTKPFKPIGLNAKIAHYCPQKITEKILSSTTDDLNAANQLINLNSLIETAYNEKEFILEMINLFLKDTPTNIKKIESAIINSDFKEIAKVAHTMKPGVGMMGLTDSSEKLKEIENIANSSSNIKLIKKLLNKVSKDCEIAFKELKEEIKKYQ